MFIVQAYQDEDERGSLSDVVVLELFAESESEAVKRAKKLITRHHYRVSGVIEKELPCYHQV